MSFQIRFDAEKRIVRVFYLERSTLAAHMETAQMVAEKFRHLEPLRILVDARLGGTGMEAQEQRQFGRFVGEHPVLRRARTAILHRAGFYPTLLIAEEAASYGGQRFRAFILEAEAEKWLLE